MTFTMRHQSEIARLQQPICRPLHFEPTPSSSNDVEHEAILHRWQRECPRCREFGTAIENAGHPQEMECLADRIRDRWQNDIHVYKYPLANAIIQLSWTNEHRNSTNRHG